MAIFSIPNKEDWPRVGVQQRAMETKLGIFVVMILLILLNKDRKSERFGNLLRVTQDMYTIGFLNH